MSVAPVNAKLASGPLHGVPEEQFAPGAAKKEPAGMTGGGALVVDELLLWPPPPQALKASKEMEMQASRRIVPTMFPSERFGDR